MNTPDTQKPVMSLDETMEKLQTASNQLSSSPRLLDVEFAELLDVAIHHLEAGKADTARLDWMESNESTGFEHWSTGWGFNDHSFPTLRDAIDSEINPKKDSL
jgi:hypothetical protein